MKASFQMSHMTVICANMSRLLFRLNWNGVTLHHLRRKDELTVSFCVRQGQYHLASRIVEQEGGKIESAIAASGYLLMKGFLRRPVLIFGILLLTFLTLFIPTRILFVTISGNERIPQRLILAVASECGVSFGVPRNEIRSEIIKNHLLSVLPELKWVGVNTSGCVAQISVRERAPTEVKQTEPMVSSLVASRDGVIREITVRSGKQICRVGQAVKRGQLLVSGYSDCGRCIYGTRADAEIFAQTKRSLSLSALTEGEQKENIKGVQRKYGLLIGKKRINFYKGSGIYDTTCVRMYTEYPLTLPGGFQLPVALTVQEEIDYDVTPVKADVQKLEPILDQFAQDYLESLMIAGKVEQGKYQLTEEEGALRLVGQYLCDEMIGQTRSEEIVNNYEQTG